MDNLKIDYENFNTLFPLDYRREVESKLARIVPSNIAQKTRFFGSMQKVYNDEYLVRAGCGDTLQGVEVLSDVFVPNIAVIDFIVKNFDKDSYILDYGCGMGQLIVYLNKIGYKNVYGFDVWNQTIQLHHAKEFLFEYGLQDNIIEKDAIEKFKFKLVVCLYEYHPEDIVMKKDNFEYIVPTIMCTKSQLDGDFSRYSSTFDQFAEYHCLIQVWKRKVV